MRLHLHVGHGKTGSSFLQSWLALNATALQQQEGLLYPLLCPLSGRCDQQAAQGHFSMGNGFVLDPLLVPNRRTFTMRRWKRRLLRHHNALSMQTRGLVFSCEPWARTLGSKIDQLLKVNEVLEFDGLDVLLLVRDPLDHAISVYAQMVKRHGFTGGIDDWLEIYDFPDVLLDFLKVLADNKGSVGLRVDHYGRKSSSLLDILSEWLFLSGESIWINTERKLVNRSLTHDEVLLMRWLNSRDPAIAAAVGEDLVNKLPSLQAAKSVPSLASVDRFIARWTDQVDEINSILPCEAAITLEHSSLFASAEADNLESLRDVPIELLPDQLDCLLNHFSARSGR